MAGSKAGTKPGSAGGGARVMTFEQFANANNAPRFSMDVATNRMPRASEGQKARIMRQQYTAQQTNAARREQLRNEYATGVAQGRFREPTRVEQLQATARGHSDNQAVQAARRLLQKRGLSW